MAKHIVKGYIVATRHSWEKEAVIGFQMHKPSAEYSPENVIVREDQIEVEVPDGLDITADLVANLEERKRELRVDLSRKLMRIDDQIGKLTSLEYVPKAPADAIDDYPF